MLKNNELIRTILEQQEKNPNFNICKGEPRERQVARIWAFQGKYYGK